MDKIIEPKKGWARVFSKKALPYWGIAILIILIASMLLRNNVSTMRVNTETITISEVKSGLFNDYVRVTGQVLPITTMQISPLETGVVKEIYIEEGAKVKAGDPILLLSNENLNLQILNAEADLAEKDNMLRNTLISMEQQKLTNQQDILQLEIDVRRYLRTYKSQKQLYADNLISKEDYLRAEEDYSLAKDRLNLVKHRAVQDSLYRSIEVKQMQESLDNMRLHMMMIRKRKDNLLVKAPINGELGLLDVVLGQSVAEGSKIGQINNLSSYKIEAQFDEHYIDRITTGLEADFERQNENFRAVIRKVYPEVRDGKFKADFKFSGEQPDNIRSGQTYYMNLQLGQPEKAILIPRGSFYQNTGGQWIYVISKNGKEAYKREIRIGRQNPQYYEVIDGLKPGDKVITSSYDNFGNNERLVLD
ncbi:MAG: efflux transporter periplasmic adaptor subunit [Bacteroides sp. 43_108]|nr:MAG: efflux transporter periplasmic adaptor subunit [Bacteroides sp. 43_108]